MMAAATPPISVAQQKHAQQAFTSPPEDELLFGFECESAASEFLVISAPGGAGRSQGWGACAEAGGWSKLSTGGDVGWT